MAITASDWTIDRATKVISYIGGDHGASPTYATVIEFHRWLQDLADDAVASGDDELDITNTDPSRRSTDNIITLINGYTINEAANNATEHLYDGSIIMDDGDTIYDGIVNFGNPDVVIQILQSGEVLTDDWWNLATGFGANANDAAGISHRFMVQTRKNGVDIDGRRLIGTTRVMDTGAGVDHFTFGEFKINGTARGNNVLALTNADDLNNSTSETTIAGWTDITNTEGLNLIDVDADTVDEEYYSRWDTSGSHIQNDYYERLKWLSRDGSASTIHGMNGEHFRGITNSFPFSGTGWDPLTNDVGAWGTAVTMTSVARTWTIGEAVHEDTATPTWKGTVVAQDDTNNSVIIRVETGTIADADTFTGQESAETGVVSGTPTAVTGGGTFTCLAVDDDGATGNLYVQIMNGVTPPNGATVYESTDHTNSLSITSAPDSWTVSTPFVGVSTGSNIIGAYGIGFETDQINDSDVLTALDGLTYSRPNLVTNTVGGLSQDGDDDRVIVAEWDTVTDAGGGAGYDVNGDPAFNKKQLAINATYTSADQGTITIGHANGDNATIPVDTPSSGTIRVIDDDGFERWIPYSSWSGTVFTVNTGHADIGSNNDFDTVNATTGNLCYITYIDENAATTTLTFQSTYVADRDLVVVVRNGFATGPIKQFIAEWSLTSSNQTINAIRTTDL